MEKRILITDDEPAVSKLLERVLGKNGYTAISCNSSIRGIDLLQDINVEFDYLRFDDARYFRRRTYI